MTPPPAAEAFRQTRWSLVRELDHATHAQARMDELCIRYWMPVQAYFADHGFDADASADLTRAFFDRLLREGVERASEYGRFRLFLMDELERFLASPASAGAVRTSAHTEHALRRDFAVEIIAHAMTRLRDEARDAGRLPMFERLQRYLSSAARTGEYARDADEMGVHVLSVTMAVRRLRQRFRELIEDELVQLTRDGDAHDAERQALREALERTP